MKMYMKKYLMIILAFVAFAVSANSVFAQTRVNDRSFNSRVDALNNDNGGGASSLVTAYRIEDTEPSSSGGCWILTNQFANVNNSSADGYIYGPDGSVNVGSAVGLIVWGWVTMYEDLSRGKTYFYAYWQPGRKPSRSARGQLAYPMR